MLTLSTGGEEKCYKQRVEVDCGETASSEDGQRIQEISDGRRTMDMFIVISLNSGVCTSLCTYSAAVISGSLLSSLINIWSLPFP